MFKVKLIKGGVKFSLKMSTFEWFSNLFADKNIKMWNSSTKKNRVLLEKIKFVN